MFDVGMWELVLLALISLIVVGPERLPKLATSLGRFTGKIRRMAQTIQRDIDRQIAAEDQQKLRDSMQSMIHKANAAEKEIKQDLAKNVLSETTPTTSEASHGAPEKTQP